MSVSKSTIMRIMPVLVFAGIAAFFGLALLTAEPSRVPSTLIGKSVPASNFPALPELQADGKPVPGFTNTDLSAGRPTVVNFWASWCAQCVDEHPLLGQLAASSGVEVLGVNYKDTDVAARRYLGRYGNPYSAVGTDATGRTAIDWGVYGMPETFVIDGQGRIVYKHIGPLSPASVAAKILPAIEKAKSVAAVPAAAPTP